MKPARQTSADAARSRSSLRKRSRRNRRASAKSRWSMTSVSMPAPPRAVEPAGIGAVGDDDGDARVERTALDRVDERLEVAAAPGNEHADAAAVDRSTPAIGSGHRRRPCAIVSDARGSRARRTARDRPSTCAACVRRAHDDQADAHVERAQHVVVRHVARCAAATGRSAARSTRRASMTALVPVGQDARQVVGDAAAGDVRHPLDRGRRRAAAGSRGR